MRILIVEDEKRLAGTLQELLRRHGYTADVCYGSTGSSISLTWGENTLSWYGVDALNQLNVGQRVYRYIALMDTTE